MPYSEDWSEEAKKIYEQQKEIDRLKIEKDALVQILIKLGRI